MVETKVKYPIFDIDDVAMARLAQRFDVSVRYLFDLKESRKTVGPKFRRKASRIGRTGPGLCRGRSTGRVLGNGPQILGSRSRQPDPARGGCHDFRAGWL